MCIIAMAAEAAAHLLPHQQPVAFLDARFDSYVWADPRDPGPTQYRIAAEVLKPATGTGNRIRVRVLSDVRSPARAVLLKDREHARIDDGEHLVAQGDQIIACMRRHGRTFEPGPWPEDMLAVGTLLGADIRRAFTT